MVSIMTALWFEHLRGARPRLGQAARGARCCTRSSTCWAASTARYLTELRAFGGLQSYPSRLKDPVPADFSTGSVGIGATATIWSALAHRYVAGHFEVPRGGRARRAGRRRRARRGRDLGGARRPDRPAPGRGALDRRPQPAVARPDRPRHRRRPDPRRCSRRPAGRRSRSSTAACCASCSSATGGEALRRRIDEMPNEEYQRLLRATPAELRERLPGSGRGSRDVARLVARPRRRRARAARSATSAATTSPTCSTRSPRRTPCATARR